MNNCDFRISDILVLASELKTLQKAYGIHEFCKNQIACFLRNLYFSLMLSTLGEPKFMKCVDIKISIENVLQNPYSFSSKLQCQALYIVFAFLYISYRKFVSSKFWDYT